VLIEAVETKWAKYQPDIRIEVVLSGELLNLDIDRWSWEVESLVPPVPIGCRYSFAIRSLERMQAGHWHRHWHARWGVLTGQLHQYGALEEESALRTEGGDGIRELVAEFENNAKLVCLTLSAPPSGTESGGGAEVAVALRAGVPIMVWHREDCDSEEFLAAARELLHGDGPGDVLQRIKQVRTLAYRSHAGHVGHYLGLMWDDPNRLVVPPDLGPPREASVA
jgi:NTP-dependent ternary conflict system VMAP-like protein